MADDLVWQIGDITVTRVVESVAHIPAAGLLPSSSTEVAAARIEFCTSALSRDSRGSVTLPALTTRSCTGLVCVAGSTSWMTPKSGSTDLSAGRSLSWLAIACWPPEVVAIHFTNVSAAALDFDLVATARPKSASPYISLVLPAPATSGKAMGRIGNGLAPQTPAADSAAVIALVVAYSVYQVPIMIMPYFPVRKSLLASGYCW